MPHQLLERLKQAVLPSQWRSVAETLRGLVLWRPALLVLPRSHVHWMKLDVRGVPARFILSSLRLQLRQFLGEGDFGFAYSIHGEVATLWYWSEAAEGEFARLTVGNLGKSDIAPWPETLLRSSVDDGLHLLKCQSGFEALFVVSHETVRTRWFPSLPTVDAWAMFVRDAGQAPEKNPLPSPREIKLQLSSPRNWKLSSSLIQPISTAVWVGSVAIALAGLLIVMGGSYSLKLDSALSTERMAYEKLAQENAATIALQEQIKKKIDYLSGFRGARSPIPQLDLMKILVESGIVSEANGISLAEWEYRSSRLRLLFSVPQDNFSLGLFLSVLERQPALRDIKLMPDTPPLTVGIQAAIAAPLSQDKASRPSVDVDTTVPDRR